jgi:hypothetical protein
VKATQVYAAKRALFDLLATQAQTGFPLDGVQVTYQAPGDPGRADLFAGGVRFEQTEASGHPGRVVVDEISHLTVIVRVSDPELTVRAAEVEVERIADVLADLFDGEPFLDDGKEMQVVGFGAGQGDYAPSEGWGRSMLAFEVDVQCLIQ